MNRFFSVENILKTFVIILFITLSLGSALQESLTYDEIVHIQEGKNAWYKHEFLIDTNNPPFIRELQILPLVLHADKFISNTQPNMKALPARIITILMGVVLLFLIMKTTKQYIGRKESLFAGLLFSLEPTLLGNSHYVTQDIGVALLFFIAFTILVSLIKKYNSTNVLCLSIILGLGMASKITFLPYFFVSAFVLGIFLFKKQIFEVIFSWKVILFQILLISLLVVWATYFFKTQVVVQQREDSSRVSAKLLQYAKMHNNLALKDTIVFLQTIPVPLGDYLGTLKNNVLRSTNNSPCFFLGSFSPCQIYFMMVNLFLKTPLPLIIFFITSVILFLQKKKRNNAYVYYLIPAASTVLCSLVLGMSPWVRYILPLYPFLIICASTSLPFWIKTKKRILFFSILLLWFIIGSLSSFPHFISYANEITLHKKIFLFSDSNMDWGQSLPDVKKFAEQSNFGTIYFSYFGRDNGDLYGLHSKTPYGSYKGNEICEFHVIKHSHADSKSTLISVSNWYNCGYSMNPEYSLKKVKGIIGNSLLLFY